MKMPSDRILAGEVRKDFCSMGFPQVGQCMHLFVDSLQPDPGSDFDNF